MSNKKSIKKPQKQKSNPLLILAAAVAVVAIVIVLFIPDGNSLKNSSKESTAPTDVAVSNGSGASGQSTATQDTASNETAQSTADNTGSGESLVQATINDKGDVVIPVADITETATFYELDYKGTKMALFAVKAQDGTIRTAFDTCQVCNGSPYAYFKQQGNTFQCQNCGNIYSVDMIEQERGGCNPVPIMEDEKSVSDSEIIIPAALIKENAVRFENWKKF